MIYFLTVRFLFLLVTCSFLAESAPVQESNRRQPRQKGCYYLSDHYDNGERIDTNEPCLNCTCLNSMLMCYLRICPFVKPVGEECIIEREEGDCCPKIWCPEVIKDKENTLKASEKRKQQQPGCYLDDQYYPDGAMLPHDPKRPCEVCYCIRNSTACVMQECELKVDGCFPIYKEGQCCPCRYNCTYEEATPTPPGVTPMELAEGCTLPDGSFVEDGEAVNSTNPCEHCYCMRNEVVCAIQECQAPGHNCRPVPPKPDQCCPDRYECLVNTISPNSFEKPISLQFSTVFTTSFGTTTTSIDLSTLKGKITDGSKVKGAPKKEVVDEILSPVYIPPQQTKSTEASEEEFSTVPSISQKSSTLSESHIQEGVTLISTLIDSSSLVPSTESEAEVEEKAKSITVTSAESLFSDKFTATTSEKILTEDAETTVSSLSDEKSSESTSIYYEASRTSSPTDQSQQTTIKAEAINSEEHYKKVTVHEEKRKPTEYSQQTTIQGEMSSTTEYSQKSTTQEYTSSTEYYQESTTHGDIKSSTEYSSPTTIQAETSSPTEQSQQHTGQTDISHSTGISHETTSETQPPRKGYGVKGSSFSHKSSSTRTPSAAPENAEVSTESYSSEKTSSPSESHTSQSSASTTQTLKEKANSVKESTFSPPNIIRVKGRRPSTPSEEPEKVSSTEPTTASQEYNFKEGESDDNKIKQSTGVKSSQKKGHIKGKRPQIKEKPLLPVGVIPGEKKQSASTTAFPSVKGRPSVMSIPGEGSCHVGKVSYKHGQAVPSSDVCKMSCQCSRGKIYCVEIVCEILQPENYGECQLVRNQSQCCPHYECGTSITKPAEYLDITEFTSVDGVFVSSTTVQRTGTYTTESSSVFPISSTESTVIKEHVFKTDATTEPSYSSFTKETPSSSSSSTTAPSTISSTEISHISNEVEVSTIVDYTDFSAHEKVSIHEEGFPTEQSHPLEEIGTTSGPTKLFSVAETSEEAATASVNYDSTVKEIKYTTQKTFTIEKESAEFTSGEASTESPVTENSDAVSSTFEETDSVANKYPSTVLHSTSTVEETPKTTFEDLTVEKIEGISTTTKTSSFPSITSEEQTEIPEVGTHTNTDQKSSTPSEVTSTSEVITERYSHSDSVGVTEDIHHSETAGETSTHSSVTSTKIAFGPEVTDKFDTIVIEKDVGTTFEYETSSDKEETSFATSIKPLEASESSEDSEKLTSPKTNILSAHEESSVTPSPEEVNYEAESTFQTDSSIQEKFTFRSTIQTGHPSTQTPFVDLSSTEKPQPTDVDLSSTEKHQPFIVETVASEGDNTELSSTTVVVSSAESQSAEYIPKTAITSTLPANGLDDVSGTTVSKVGTEESHLAETTTIVSKVDSTILSESDLSSDLHVQHSSTEKDIAELQKTSPDSLQTTAQQDGISTYFVHTSTESDTVHSTDASPSDAARLTTLKGHDISDSTERTTEQSHIGKSTEIQGSTETPTTTQKDTEEQEEHKTASGISEEHEVTFTTKEEQEKEKTTFHLFKDTTTDSNDITRFIEYSQGTSTVIPVKDDFSTVSSASTTAEKGLSFDIIDVDSSDDSVKFTETKSDAVSSTEGTETSSKQEIDAESDISHVTEFTTPSSKPAGSSIALSVGTTVFEETTSKQEIGAETDKNDEAKSTSLSPKVAESSSTFEDSFHFEEATASHKVDITSDISQQEQFTSPSSESGYSTELQTKSSYQDGTEAPKPVEETDVSPIIFVSEDGKTTSKSEESTEETLKEEFSGVSLDSKTANGEINESEFSTAHAEEIRSSSVSGISSTQTLHELDYDTKSITPGSVSVPEQESTVSEENFTSVEGISTTNEEKLLPSEEILNPTYEVADNEISNDFVTEFPDSDDGKFENEGIFSKKKPGTDSEEEAIKSEKHTTESYDEIIKPEQHTTESHSEAIEPEQHTTESHAESIKPEQHTTKSHIEPEQHTTESHIDAIEPEQHTTESHAESIKPEQHTTKSHIEPEQYTTKSHIEPEQHTTKSHIEPEQHTTESHIEAFEPEQHTTESHIEAIEPEQHATESHSESIEPEQHTTEPHIKAIEPLQHTTESHIEAVEPKQHTTESHAESIKPEQLTTQSHFEVSTSESETSKPHEENVKTQEVITHISESTDEEKVAFAVETSSEKEIPISHEYQEADSQFPGLQETSTDQLEDKVYITESEDYEGKKVYTETSDSYGNITSQGVTDESEKSTVDLSEPHKFEDHAEKSETITFTSSTTSLSDHETSKAELTSFPSSTERSTFISDSFTTVESVKSSPAELSHSSDSLVVETSDVSITEHDSTPAVKPETVESTATHKEGEFKPFSVESTSLPIMIIDGASTNDEKTIQAESSSPSTILSHEDIETTQEPHQSTLTAADQPKVDETITDKDKTFAIDEEVTKDANVGIPVSESTEYHSETTERTIISSTDSPRESSPAPEESANAITDAAEVPKGFDISTSEPENLILKDVTGSIAQEETEVSSSTVKESSPVPEESANTITDAAEVPKDFGISTSEPENLILKDVTGSIAQEETEVSSSTVKDVTSKRPATEYASSSVRPTQLSTVPDSIEDSERTETSFSVIGADHHTEDASLAQDIDSRHTSPENVEDVIHTRVFTTYEPTQGEKETPTIRFETTEKPTTLQKAFTTALESTTTVQPHVAKNFASTSVAGDLTSTKIPEHSTHSIAEFDHDSPVVDHSEDEETIETFTDPPKQTEKPESHIKLSQTQRPLVSVEDATSTAVPQTPAVTEKHTEEKVESTLATTEAASEESDGSFDTSKASELISEPEKLDTHTIFSSDSTVVPTIVHSGTSTFLPKSEVVTQTVQTPVLLETTQFTAKKDSPTEHEEIEETKEEDAEHLNHATEKDDFNIRRTTTSSEIHISDVSEPSELSAAKPLEDESNFIEDSGKFTDHEEAHTESTIISKSSDTTTAKEEQSTVFANTPESVSPEENYDHSVLQNATEMISTEIDNKFQQHEKTTVAVSAQAGEISTSTTSEESKDVSKVTGIESKSKTTLTSEFSASTDSSTKTEKAETSSIRVEEGLISTEYSELQKHSTAAPEISELDDSKPTEIASQTSDSYFSKEDSSLIPKIKVPIEEAITHSATYDHSSTVQEVETAKTELTTKEYSERVTSSSFIHQAGDETTYDSSNEQSELDLEAEFQTSPKTVDDENTSAESDLKHSTSFVEQSEETDESFGEYTEYTSTSKVVLGNELKDPSVSSPSTTISVRDGPIHSTFTTVYDLISTLKPLKLDIVTESQHSTDEYLPADAETAEKLHETDKYLDVSTTKEEKSSTLAVSQSEDEAVKDSVIKQVTKKHESSESTDYEGLEAGSTTYAAKEFTATTSEDVVVKATTSKPLSSDILPKDSITDHGKITSSSTFSPETTSDTQQDAEAGLTDSDSKADAVFSTTTKYPQETEDIRLITEEGQEIFESTKAHLVNDTKGISLPENLLTDTDIVNEFTSPSDSKHSSENDPDLTHTALTHTTDQISTQDHGFHKQTYPPEILDEGLEENIKEFFSITSTVKSNETTSPDNFTTKSTVNLSSLPEISSDATETSLDKHETAAENLSITKESTKGSDSSILTTFPSFIPENLIDSSVIPSQQGNLPTVDADTTYVNHDIVEKKPFASSSTAVTEVNKLDESHSILTHTVNVFETKFVNQTLQVDDQKETSPTLEDKETVTSDSKVTTISDKSGFETSYSSSVSPTQDYGFHKEVYYPPKHEESTQFVQHYDTTKLPISFSTYIDESATQKSEIPESSAHSDSTFASITDTQTDQSVTIGKKSTTDFAVTSIKESTDAHTDVSTEELTDEVTETSSDDTEIHVTDSDHASSVFSTSDVTSTFHTGSVSGAHSSDEDEIKQKSSLHTQTTISSSGFFTTEYAKSSVEDQKVTDQTQEKKLTEEPHFEMSSASSFQPVSNEETEKKEFETVTATELSSTSRKPTDYDYLYTTYISHVSSSDGFSKDADSFSTVKLEITGATKEDTNVEERHSTLHNEGSDILTTASDNVASANISEESIIQTKLTTGYEPTHLINDTTTDRVSDLDTSELLRKTTVQDLEVSSVTDNSTADSFDAEVHSTKYEISSKTVTFLPKQTDIVSTHVTEIFEDSTSTPQDHTKAVGVTSTQDDSDLHTEFSFNEGVSEHHNTDKIDESEEIISSKSPSTSIVDQFSTFSGHQNESFTETIHETTKSHSIKNEEGKFSDISGPHNSSSTSVTIETLGVSGHDTSSTHIPTFASFETSSHVFGSSPGQETQPEGVEKVYDIESFTIKESVLNETTTKIETDSTFIASDSWNLSEDQDRIVTVKSSVSDDKSAATEAYSTFSSLFTSTSAEHVVSSTTTHPQTSTSWAVDTGETSSTAGTSKSQEGVTSSVHYASSSTPHGEILETISSFFPHSSPPSILFESHKSSSLPSSSTTTSSTSHKHTTAKPADDTTHHFPEDGYCLYENEVYNSAEQIPRKDPCEFCFCFRGDIICLQQSCPPPIRGCYATPINGFCCPRFHCPVQEMHFNLSTTTTTTADPREGKYLPPADQSTGCEIEGNVYRVHQVVRPSSGPCMLCRCEMGGIMKCDPRDCQPQAPLLLRLNREFFKKR